MASVTFILKEPQLNIKPKDQAETLVYMVFRYNNKRLKLSTHEKILPKYWDKVNQCALNNPYFSKDDFNQRLLNKKGLILDINRKLLNDNEIPTNEILLKKFNERDGDRISKSDNVTRSSDLNGFIEEFIKDLERGKRLTPDKKEKYKPLTIKNYRGFQVQFNLYQEYKKKKLSFDHITIDFYDDFVNFLNRKNYSPNTIGRHIKNLKTIMRIARDEGLHNNSEIERKKFKVLKVETDQIYLNQQELDKLYNLDLSNKPTLEIARDIFLIGCYTAQRFSDYNRITEKNIKTLANETKIIELIQAKTGERVNIPIHWQLEAILKKYDNNPPRIYEQKLNERIKKVGEQAEINEIITIESIKGGLKITQEYPKYALIKTHTARRSGATNMYLAGIPTLDIMKITGHKTEREFLKYIRISKEETAEMLSTHPFFMQKLNVV